MKLKILSHDVEVRFENPQGWAEGGMGRCSVKEGLILINETMTDDMQKSTLLHEITHFISDLSSSELNEQQVDAVALGMFSLFKDNPDVISTLIERS